MAGNVVQFGEMALKIKAARSYFAAKDDCRHRQLELDADGNIVRCEKCGVQVDAYWAIEMLSHEFGRAYQKLEQRKQELENLAATHVVLKAALKVQQAWRSKGMDPCCPHCNRGIRATDGFGSSMTSKQFEDARRSVGSRIVGDG